MQNTKSVGVAFSDPALDGATIANSTITSSTLTGATITSPTITSPTITSPSLGDATAATITASGAQLPIRGALGFSQGAPTAKTVSATLTAVEIQAGIITVNQAAGASSAQQLPLASAMDTQFSTFAAGDAFDFSVINTSTVDAEDASITTNTGWTLVGNMDIHAYSAAGSLNSSGRFRARKTGTAAWTLYRLS